MAALTAVPSSVRAEGTIVSVCGDVAGYTPPSPSGAGSVTMDGDLFTLAPGAQIVGQITTGVESCLTFVFDSNGQISDVSSDDSMQEDNSVHGAPEPTKEVEPTRTPKPSLTGQGVTPPAVEAKAAAAVEPISTDEAAGTTTGIGPAHSESQRPEHETAPRPTKQSVNGRQRDDHSEVQVQSRQEEAERVAVIAGSYHSAGVQTSGDEDEELPRTGGAAPVGRPYSVVSLVAAALAGLGVFSTRRNA